MTSYSLLSSPTVSEQRCDLLEALLEKALLAGERYVEQFSQLAALARAIEVCDPASLGSTKLIATMQSVAKSAEEDAQLEVDVFQGLLAGELMRLRAELERIEMPKFVVAPSTNTRH
ncbi:MAG: hypothetical protein EPN73_10425 [Paraburkholderia sp.]|uniref:hypothetical protein n=1 Tax=Paraburkholderia sp. TaxID=1926495 RepID=UPI00122B08BA|nr:hypothetical protein [Paraburkholderia sp.]TAL96339.1 MAG: hypothetical protein EPN73_10425 [Paraburkholderia sp.]